MIHMIIVLRIYSRYCNHQPRGNLNGTGSVIYTSQIRTNLCYFCLVLLCYYARLFVDALWSPAGKGLTS